jgi:hypothetical protein
MRAAHHPIGALALVALGLHPALATNSIDSLTRYWAGHSELRAAQLSTAKD